MLFNIMIILLILVLLGAVVYRGVNKLKKIDATDYEEELSERLTLEFLEEEVKVAISNITRERIQEQNCTREEYELKEKRQKKVRNAVNEAGYADQDAKFYLLMQIDHILQEKKYDLENHLNEIIPFNQDEKLTSVDKFEILLYCYKREFKGLEQGFNKMFDDGDFLHPKFRTDMMPDDKRYYMFHNEECIVEDKNYAVTEEDIAKLYSDKKAANFIQLDYQDKLNIIAQRIYEETYSPCGVTDLLYYAGLDEIDGGVSGIPDDLGQMSVRERENPPHWKSVWITYRGLNVYLECLYFKSRVEFGRVCQNIYTYDSPAVLSKEEGKVIGKTKDGSRIAVGRPDFADTDVFFLRKERVNKPYAPYEWVNAKNQFIPVHITKWLERAYEVLGFCGTMGSGKTQLLKAMSIFAPDENIRGQEIRAELHLRHAYPKKNIVFFQETKNNDGQAAIDYAKKTNALYFITGEAAEAKQVAYLVQNKGVAFKGFTFTHHANSHAELIRICALNLLQENLYKDENNAIEACAKTFNICVHISRDPITGKRYIDSITECIPTSDYLYPSEEYKQRTGKEMDLDEAYKRNTIEYYKRITNPVKYEINTLVEFDQDKQIYVFVNRPSKYCLERMKSGLTKREYDLMLKDFEIMENLTRDPDFYDDKETKKVFEEAVS